MVALPRVNPYSKPGVPTGSLRGLQKTGVKPKRLTVEEAKERRDARYLAAADWTFFRSLQKHTHVKTFSGCMLQPMFDVLHVSLVSRAAGSYTYSGLVRCRNHWVCPFCTTNFGRQLNARLAPALKAAIAKGWVLYLVTYTVSHSRHDLLTEEFGRFRFLMKKIYDSKVFKRIKEVSTFHGACHTWDLTSGSHGWHLHRHDILAFAEPVPDLELRLQARADYVAVGGKMDGYRVDVHVERVEVTPEICRAILLGL